MEGFKILSDQIVTNSFGDAPYIFFGVCIIITFLLSIYYGFDNEEVAAVAYGCICAVCVTFMFIVYSIDDSYEERVIKAVQIEDSIMIDYDTWNVEYEEGIFTFRKKLEDID